MIAVENHADAGMRDAWVKLPSGRTLAYTDVGAPDWPCVMFFHGAPSSRLRIAYLEPSFVAERLRVISPDRPGYGGSDPQPGRSLDDWPADVEALADELGIERFVSAGHSSGGPYALAAAALLPRRVTGAIVLAGVTDMRWRGAWEGYPAPEAEVMRLGDEERAIAWCEERFGRDGSRFMTAFPMKLSKPDERLYDDEDVAALLATARAEAFRQGVIGYAVDIAVQAGPWPFDPATITVPVRVVHGDQDLVLPLAHSRHTAELVPGSRLVILPDHGHFTVLAALPSMVSSLAD